MDDASGSCGAKKGCGQRKEVFSTPQAEAEGEVMRQRLSAANSGSHDQPARLQPIPASNQSPVQIYLLPTYTLHQTFHLATLRSPFHPSPSSNVTSMRPPFPIRDRDRKTLPPTVFG